MVKKCILNIWNPVTCSCKNGKYSGSVINNLVIYDETIETTKSILTETVPTKSTTTNFNEKR